MNEQLHGLHLHLDQLGAEGPEYGRGQEHASRIDKVGLAKQAAMGTKQTTAEYWNDVESAEPEHQREIIEQEGTTGVRHPSGIDYGVEFWELPVKLPARYSSLPRWLSAFFGQPTTTTPDVTGAPTGRNHAFGSNVPKEHSIYVVRKDPSTPAIDLFWDALGDEISLMIEPNGFLGIEAKLVCKELDDTQGDPSPTLDASSRIAFDTVKCYASVDGGGETEIKVRRWQETYKNNVDTDYDVLGQRRLLNIKEGNTECEVTFEPRNALTTEYRRALQSDPAKVKLRMEALGATIGAAVKFKLETILYACEYIEAPLPVNAESVLKSVEIKARARYDESVSKFVEHNVVNTVASY